MTLPAAAKPCLLNNLRRWLLTRNAEGGLNTRLQTEKRPLDGDLRHWRNFHIRLKAPKRLFFLSF